jgi:histidine triad (HIT) family protein
MVRALSRPHGRARGRARLAAGRSRREASPADPLRCIFCAIVRKEAPAAVLLEDGAAIAFLTLGPLRPGHALVVPRRHATTLRDVPPADWAAVARMGLAIAELQHDRLGSEGTTLFLASGEAGEQSVPHLHLHVVPRGSDDRLDLTSWWAERTHAASRAELASVARRLRPGRV